MTFEKQPGPVTGLATVFWLLWQLQSIWTIRTHSNTSLWRIEVQTNKSKRVNKFYQESKQGWKGDPYIPGTSVRRKEVMRKVG